MSFAYNKLPAKLEGKKIKEKAWIPWTRRSFSFENEKDVFFEKKVHVMSQDFWPSSDEEPLNVLKLFDSVFSIWVWVA